jgi:hypothetical protein
VWGKIYRGEFKPERLAEVERAMLEWASANGHDLGESTVRDRARKLLKAIDDEGENPA